MAIVAAVKAAGGGDGEVEEEGGRLRGRKDHAQLTPLGIVKIQPLQRPKFDHLGATTGRRAPCSRPWSSSRPQLDARPPPSPGNLVCDGLRWSPAALAFRDFLSL